MQVIITMAGKGSRFSEAGFADPKPIVMVGGKPAIQYLLEQFPLDWKIIFVIGNHFKESTIESVLTNLRPTAKIIFCEHSERGPIDTVQAAVPILNLEKPVIVSYCDLSFIWDSNQFVNAVAKYDAAIVSFQGFHPTYFGPNSYCHLEIKDNEVIELQEKKLFTKDIEEEISSIGLYYFKTANLLKEALLQQEIQDLKYSTEYYTSLSIQALLNVNKNLKVLNYPVEQVIQFGTPSDIERFEFWNHILILKRPIEAFKFQHIEISKRPTSFEKSIFEKEKSYWQKIMSPKNA